MSAVDQALAELGYKLKSDPDNHDIIVYSSIETVYDPEETFIEHIIQIDKSGLDSFINIFKEIHFGSFREPETKNVKDVSSRLFLPIHYTNSPLEYREKRKLPLKLIPLLAKKIEEVNLAEE
jgi:hypothetical protein